MTQYITRQNDELDRICWAYYGTQIGTLEAVLEANKGLSAQGDRLPAGLVIELPELVVTKRSQPPRLWD